MHEKFNDFIGRHYSCFFLIFHLESYQFCSTKKSTGCKELQDIKRKAENPDDYENSANCVRKKQRETLL